MDVGSELPAAMAVTEEVTDYGEDGTKGLEGNMPSGADDLDGTIRSRIEKRREETRTPRTMPVGKMMPKARIWMAI